MQEFWVCDSCKSLVRRMDPKCCYLLSWFVRVIGRLFVDLLVGFWLALGWVPTIREAVGLAIARSALASLFYIGAGIFLVRLILELGLRQRSGPAGSPPAPRPASRPRQPADAGWMLRLKRNALSGS